MAIDFFKNILSPNLTETGTKKSTKGQLGLINTNLDTNLDFNTNVDARTTSSNVVNTDSRQYNFSDQRQVSIIYNSPNSTLSTKKSDNASPVSSPLVTANPSTSGADVPVSIPVDLGLSTGSGFLSNVLLIGGLGVGGIILLSAVGGKKK